MCVQSETLNFKDVSLGGSGEGGDIKRGRKLMTHVKQLALHCLNCELHTWSTLSVLSAALCCGLQSSDCSSLTCIMFLIDFCS